MTSAALLAGAAVGGLMGLVLAPCVAFGICRAQQSKSNGPNASTTALGNPAVATTRIRMARLTAVLLSGTLLLLAGWTYTFGMPQSAGLSFFLALTFLLWLLRGRLAVRMRIALTLAVLGMVSLSWKTPARELRGSLQRFQEKKDTAGPTAFSTAEKLSILGLNVAMASGGFVVGFSEVARETISLCFKGPSTRVWDSDFAMRSPRVRTEVQKLVEFAQNHGRQDGPVLLPESRISWSRYSMKTDSLRVALALNSPMELRGTARREGAHWRLELVGRARAEYPRKAVHSILTVDGSPVHFDEGLFWVLQQSGWLHPYTAEWRWSILSDDPRLRELHAPILSLREQLLDLVLSFN